MMAVEQPPVMETLPPRPPRRGSNPFTATAFRSSVRPLVTLVLVGGFVWGFVDGRVAADVFVPSVTGVLGYWFASREAAKRGSDA